MGHKSLAAVLATVVVIGSIAATAPPAVAAPSGFSMEALPFTGLTQPTAVEFAATGQVFVAERSGVIDVYDNLDDPSPRDVADLRLRVFNGGDRGLLGMALDPQYPARPYLWALYTKNADIGGTPPKFGSGLSDSDDCGDGGANNCRVSAELARLTLDPADGTWTGEERVLLNEWCQQFGSHSIGTVVFGADGYLYVGSGDGANYNSVDTGATGTAPQRCNDPAGAGGALRSQAIRRAAADPMTLDGAILRLDPDTGLAAPGNPFAADADPLRQRVIAYGLRNPYRFTPRPGTNELWIGDVGWNGWEELDRVVVDGTAENFGWPCYEGPNRQSGYDSANAPLCESLYSQGPTAIQSPAYAYDHGSVVGGGCPSGGSAISAVAFGTNATAYPAAYRGGVFFGDYSRRCLWFAPMTGSTINASAVTMFDATTYPADLKIGPSGDLYVVDIGTGQVKRIRYTAGGNTPPIAVARANPADGPTPLTVQFDGSGSSDPDANSSITYAWDLDGDGQFDDSTAINPTWTYTTPGAVTARLRVTDNLGAATVASVTVTPGSNAPTISLTSSATTTPWKVGDTVTFSATASDVEDGAIPAERISTRLVLKHCPGGINCHEHVQGTFPGTAGSFVAPDHEYPAHLELQTTATDSSGITATASLRLDPATVSLAFDTVPSGLQVTVGSEERTAPFTMTAIQGSVTNIAVDNPQQLGSTFEFRSWSDSGGIAHDITANANASYTATFEQTSAPPAVAGLVGSWSFDEGSGTSAVDRSGSNNNGILEGGPTWTTSGKYGGALSFDGANDRVSIPDSNSLDLNTAMTMTAWVRPTTLGSWRQVLLKESASGLAYALYAAGETGTRPNGSLTIGGADRYVDAPGALVTGTWTHLAMSYDGTTMRLYVNGSQVATRAQTGSVPTTTGALRIGGNAIWGEWFTGQLDEVRVYSRALTAAEVVSDSTNAGTADTVPPSTPTGVTATGFTSSANVSWTASTDNQATPTYELHRSVVSGFSPVTSTRIAAGLTATAFTDTPLGAGTYYYRVLASDGVNVSAASVQASATVTGDVTAPSVPGGVAAAVSGTTVNVGWSAATDDIGVQKYQVRRTAPGGVVTTTDITAPTVTFADANVSPGAYSYAVRALDAAGNSSAWSNDVPATVVVDQSPPSVAVTAPTTGTVVTGTTTMTATATDDIAVAGVQFRLDGTVLGTEDTVAPYQLNWNSTGVANGSHQITAVARDTAGKTTTSVAVAITVANTAPPGPAGLVAGWSFDEASGSTTADASGNGNTGTLEGGAVRAVGRFGGAISFDGVNDAVAVPDVAALDLTTTLTLSAWIRPTSLGAWRSVLMKERPGGLSYALYATGQANNRPSGYLAIGNSDRAVNATAAIAANTWTHLTMTYDGTTMRYYVNGAQVATRAQTGAVATSTGALRIGGNSVWGEWFAGQIDEVRIYNRVLTAAEVVTVRDTPLPAP